MQKKNFLNSLIAAMLLLSGTSILVSCDDIVDNPTPVIQPPVKQVVETVANVTGANPSDVTAALEAIVTNKAIKEAAAKGEPIKITVAGSGVSTDATDQTITIPQKNGANIEIAFETVPTGTDSNSLVIEASEGTGNLPSAARNNLTVTMPPSEGLAIIIELPKTTVTLKTDGNGEVIYQDVIAKTAKSTIIIDKGVTIKEHELVGGNIVVNNGGAIETLAVTVKGEKGGMICLGSWWCGVSFKGAEPDYEIKKEDGSYYLPKHVIVRKGEGDHIIAWTNGPSDETIESLTAGNGVTLSLQGNPRYKVIKGEGNNELHVQGGIDDKETEDVSDDEYFYPFAPNTDLVSNFAIKAEIDDDPELDPHIYTDPANLIINFNADQDNGSKTFTFENCDFDSNMQFALSAMSIAHFQRYLGFVNPDDEHPTGFDSLEELLEAGIPNKIVERDERGGYWIDDIYEDVGPDCSDFTCILKFKDCTIGGNSIAQDNVKFPLWGTWGANDTNHIKFQVIIDGTTYNAVSRWYGEEDPKNGTIELEEPQD